jgi:hypothetical protein
MIRLGGTFRAQHMLTKEHSAPKKSLEDLLAYLPCSTIVEYTEGQIIYIPDRPVSGHYDR